ncbi:rRNA maturation RNase YbeY [Pseudoalteromonas rubra]|uniref:Endoribonuclease YbeY n=1 Tax=Pseudoalteromonas rubra TaxID=43658 RepID=A0A5S3WFP9_9GAMM|nr:rRNA maturation RNase YbeY [Pseudoalteromonas rubra]TMP23342.1 rRNA maturation RNase YbeY [Pseudoalteromonas rubra]TMP29208.1 rRNA maturation RNase YbeY [Pseudoalteromonas rubra]
MSLEVDLQIASDFANLPSAAQFQLWAEKALLAYKEEAEVTIRIADEVESQELNSQYRGKDKPTNVLSFPFEAPPGIELPLVGDLIICPQVVFREAEEQEKTFHDHFAHMVVHGCLHLLGFDHINEQDAEEMESLEKEFLADLGIADPYRDDV